MLLPSTLGQHVGEAATNTDPGVVGESTAQSRTVRAGHRAGLTDRLADRFADASRKAASGRSDRHARANPGVDTVGRRGRRAVAERTRSGNGGDVAEVATTPIANVEPASAGTTPTMSRNAALIISFFISTFLL